MQCLLVVFMVLLASCLASKEGCTSKSILARGFWVDFFHYPHNDFSGWRVNFFLNEYSKFGYIGSTRGVEQADFSVVKEKEVRKYGRQKIEKKPMVNDLIYGFPITATNFSMALSGYFWASSTGIYNFTVEGHTGASLQLGAAKACKSEASQCVVDTLDIRAFSGASLHRKVSATFELEAGLYYPLKIVLFNWHRSVSLRTSVQLPDGTTIGDIGSQIFQLDFDGVAPSAEPTSSYMVRAVPDHHGTGNKGTRFEVNGLGSGYRVSGNASFIESQKSSYWDHVSSPTTSPSMDHLQSTSQSTRPSGSMDKQPDLAFIKNIKVSMEFISQSVFSQSVSTSRSVSMKPSESMKNADSKVSTVTLINGQEKEKSDVIEKEPKVKPFKFVPVEPVCPPVKLVSNGMQADFYSYPIHSYSGWYGNFFPRRYSIFRYLGSLQGVEKCDFFNENLVDVRVPVQGHIYGFPITTTNFTMELHGYFFSTQSGNHTVTISADDGAFLKFGQGKTCSEDNSGEKTRGFELDVRSNPGRGIPIQDNTQNGTFEMKAGVYYPISIIVYSWMQSSGLRTRLEYPDGSVLEDIASQTSQVSFIKAFER